VQCIPIMNGVVCSLNWTITLVLTPWNTLIPLAPNVINLDAIISYVRSFYNIRTSIRMRFKLFEGAPSTICCSDNNKRNFCQLSTTYACIETHDYCSQVVTSS
jgi:hypothetical protein